MLINFKYTVLPDNSLFVLVVFLTWPEWQSSYLTRSGVKSSTELQYKTLDIFPAIVSGDNMLSLHGDWTIVANPCIVFDIIVDLIISNYDSLQGDRGAVPRPSPPRPATVRVSLWRPLPSATGQRQQRLLGRTSVVECIDTSTRRRCSRRCSRKENTTVPGWVRQRRRPDDCVGQPRSVQRLGNHTDRLPSSRSGQ